MAGVPFLYFGAQALAAPFFPNYSPVAHSASILGSDLSRLPVVLNAGAALTGIAAIVGAAGLFVALRVARVAPWIAILAATCALSIGASALWAASFPLPDPRHSSGALGAGLFAAPFVTLLASRWLRHMHALRVYAVVNVVAFGAIALVYGRFTGIDLQANEGLIQKLAALVMFVPLSALAGALLFDSTQSKRFP